MAALLRHLVLVGATGAVHALCLATNVLVLADVALRTIFCVTCLGLELARRTRRTDAVGGGRWRRLLVESSFTVGHQHAHAIARRASGTRLKLDALLAYSVIFALAVVVHTRRYQHPLAAAADAVVLALAI
jgi:hypothetical protein